MTSFMVVESFLDSEYDFVMHGADVISNFFGVFQVRRIY